LTGQKRNFYLPYLHLAPPVGVMSSEFCRDLLRHITRVRVPGYRAALFLRCTLNRTPTCDGRSDGRTDRHAMTASTALTYRVARVKKSNKQSANMSYQLAIVRRIRQSIVIPDLTQVQSHRIILHFTVLTRIYETSAAQHCRALRKHGDENKLPM